MEQGKGKMTVEHKAYMKNGVSRMIFAVLSIALEMVALVVIVTRLNAYAEWIAVFTRVLALLFVLYIYARHMTSSLKMPWIMLIMAFPVVGLVMYITVGINGGTRKMRRRYAEVDEKILPALPEHNDTLEKLRESDPAAAPIAQYLISQARYPVYDDTEVRYFSDASEGLEAQLAEMRKAERFIFFEYHAIENKESFHRIRDVMIERVRAGVEVRIFYDDMGSIGFINTDFVKEMNGYGIKCRVFNPFAPGLNIFLNNRDHRKITVIDGRVGFTGGYNIANEYFNLTHPYGYWKDTGIQLTGGAVKSLTAAFLEMWNAVGGYDDTGRNLLGEYMLDAPRDAARLTAANDDSDDASNDSTPTERASITNTADEGFVQPYADNPIDDLHVGEDVYFSIIEQAQRYVWFVTPYLIITEEMIHALSIAARRGIDVRIITPGIPDKKLIYSVTRSYYNALVRNGVRIFEYTPGFCHCKMSVSDDRVATCGTINLDYRSLYHHFENGCVLYGSHVVGEIRDDMAAMMEESREVTEWYRTGRGQFLRGWQLILRLFAPLM